LAALALRSTQAAPHAVWPGEQVTRQTPALQTCPAAQTVPHAPQLRASLRGSTQLPPHTV
jgi:hypothetical protein